MTCKKVTIFTALMFVGCASVYAESLIDIGSRRELFVDDLLVEKCSGVERHLHSPTPREVVLVYDSPWEGNGCTYRTMFRDGDLIRMWYTASNFFSEDGTKMGGHPTYYCYAESMDGLHWTKPELGLYDFNGSKQNNIVWTAPHLDNFMVFKDSNPACRPGEEYKAVAQVLVNGEVRLGALKSSDGLHWSDLGDKPIIAKGCFDTLNVVFWDPLREQYFCYLRDYYQGKVRQYQGGRRVICVATSNDFLNWSEPEPLNYVNSPDEELYTNNIQPYYRAPHIFVGFPTRYVDRGWSQGFLSLPDPEHRLQRMKFEPRFGTVLTDGLFMTSRDGRTFNRWKVPFVRAGIERKHNWVYGDCYVNCGVIETAAEDPTAPPELSFYVEENHGKTAAERTRRYTLRLDGFVSLSAASEGGEVITNPLAFTGSVLTLNFTTSAVGSVRIELQDTDGKPIPGFRLEECHEVFGDRLDRVVEWKSGSDVSALAGKSIRLRFVMKDADLYAIQFK